MPNKTQLQTNNSKLSSLITELQGKAAGGSGGTNYETCTVTFTSSATAHIIYYTLENGEPLMATNYTPYAYSNFSLDVIKGSSVAFGKDVSVPIYQAFQTTGDIEMVGGNNATQSPSTAGYVFKISGDGSITLQ